MRETGAAILRGLRFYRDCVNVAFHGAWGVAGAVGTVASTLIPLAAKWRLGALNAETMNDLVWQIPLGLFGVLFFGRVVLAPFWLYDRVAGPTAIKVLYKHGESPYYERRAVDTYGSRTGLRMFRIGVTNNRPTVTKLALVLENCEPRPKDVPLHQRFTLRDSKETEADVLPGDTCFFEVACEMTTEETWMLGVQSYPQILGQNYKLSLAVVGLGRPLTLTACLGPHWYHDRMLFYFGDDCEAVRDREFAEGRLQWERGVAEASVPPQSSADED